MRHAGKDELFYYPCDGFCINCPSRSVDRNYKVFPQDNAVSVIQLDLFCCGKEIIVVIKHAKMLPEQLFRAEQCEVRNTVDFESVLIEQLDPLFIIVRYPKVIECDIDYYFAF